MDTLPEKYSVLCRLATNSLAIPILLWLQKQLLVQVVEQLNNIVAN